MWPIDLLLALLMLSAAARASEHGANGGEGGKNDHPPAAATDHEEAGDPLAQKSAKQSSRDVKIPRALVSLLEKEYRAYLLRNKWPDQEGLKRQLLDLSVELRQKRPAALREDLRINTPTGGGVIDLADVVTPLRGAFQMQIKSRGADGAPIEGLRVFYVSQAKKRLIEGEDFGAGCGKFMEVSSYFNKKMKGLGFDLYTAGQRYLSVVGGTFVLAAFAKDALQVGSVSFMDSRYPELVCE